MLKSLGRKFICFGLMLLFFPGLLSGVESGSSLPDAVEIDITRETLDNGMEVVFSEDHSAPVVSLQLWVKAGSVNEEKLLGAGLTHFVEHLAFKGPTGELKGTIPARIQSLGGNVNAYTSFDQTVFLVNVPSPHWREALDLLSRLVLEVDFQPDEVETEREVILKEINMGMDEPSRRLSHLLWATAFRIHPYRFPVIGYREIFKQISRGELIDYYRKWYVPNNMILAAAGDMSRDDFLTQAEKTFGSYPRRSYPTADIHPEPPQLGWRQAEETMDIAQARLALAFHIPDLADADLYPLDVLALLAGQGKASRLYQELREENNLVYSISAYSYTPLYPGLFVIRARCEPEKVEEVREAILGILEDYKENPVSEQELERARARVISGHLNSLSTVAGKATELGSNLRTAGDPAFYRTYLGGISGVTAADLTTAARRYFRRDNLTEAVILPAGPATSSTPVPEESRLAIKKFKLDNGLTVLIREDHSLPLVSARLFFRGGVLAEKPERAGISQLVSRLILKGTEKRDALEIVRRIEDYGGSIQAYSARNSLGCSLNVLSSQIVDGLEILSDVARNATFPPEEIEKERENLLAAIRAEADDPRSLGGRKLRKLLFGDHPYRFSTLGTEETVRRLTGSELKEFYRKYCAAENAVLAVFGDVAVKDILPVVETAFGSMRKGELFSPPSENAPAPEGIREETVTKEEIKQTVVMQGFAGATVSDPDRYSLEMLQSIFSGLSSPLFARVRIEGGLAYYVGAYQILGLEPGAFIFYAGTVPGASGKVLEAFDKEIDRVVRGEISAEEMERNRNRLLGDFQFSLQSNRELAFRCGLDELYGLGYNAYRDYEEKIGDLTVADVARAARKYLTPDTCAIVIVEPGEISNQLSVTSNK